MLAHLFSWCACAPLFLVRLRASFFGALARLFVWCACAPLFLVRLRAFFLLVYFFLIIEAVTIANLESIPHMKGVTIANLGIILHIKSVTIADLDTESTFAELDTEFFVESVTEICC